MPITTPITLTDERTVRTGRADRSGAAGGFARILLALADGLPTAAPE